MTKSPSTENERYFMPLDRTPRRCVWREEANLHRPQCERYVNPAFARQSKCCDMHAAAWQHLKAPRKSALMAAAASDAAHAAVREK